MYDFIVVGAGSSGATLAARLSEDPQVQVLLLEAGPNYRSADTPEAIQSLNSVWGLAFCGQTQAYHWPALKARRTTLQEPRFYWRGRGVGGTSTINAQVAIRGTMEDYNSWAAEGCTGWSGEEVMPYFMRLEDDLDFGDSSYHGSGGPIPIRRTPLEEWGAVDLALRTAALDQGYGWAEDHNQPYTTGVSPYAYNGRDVRVSTNDGYLEPARSRDNLTILGNAHVDKVLFDEGRRQAIGVYARIDGQWQTIPAGEVILAAGAVHSPAILMRSGIGPATVLTPLGIELIRDLPVGENLLEHPTANLWLHLKPEARAHSPLQRWTNCCVRYSSGLDGTAPNDMMMVSLNFSSQGMAKHITPDGRIRLDKPFEDPMGEVRVWVNQCFSRGRLHITTVDPEVDPEIDENMLSDERDLIRLRDGVARLFAIARHPAVQRIVEAVDAGAQPLDEMNSRDAIDRWLWQEAGSNHHIAGTCRMGARNDPRTVIDPDGRVLGMQSLRVCDASIMPTVPCANTHLTCVMIGEHLADRIKRALKKGSPPVAKSHQIRYQGAIIKDDQVLLIRHTEHESGRSYWVIPGGRREPDETEIECVRREMLEETNLTVAVKRLLVESRLPNDHFEMRKTYLCEIDSGQASPGYEPEEDASALYAITEVAWFDLRSEASWEASIFDNPIAYPILLEIRRALGYLLS